MNKSTQEIIIALALIVLVVLLINPFNSMPDPALMVILAIVVGLFVLFTTLVWREKPADEREALHKILAGRAAFLAGTTTLVLGIIVQSINHQLDNWLVIVLVVMIFAKIIGLMYSRTRY